MAIIAQLSLFSWKNDIEPLGDLARLQFVLEHLPDEALMCQLERERRNGRDDYPVRAMWNALLSMLVFGHTSMNSLLRELRRNAQLRWMCGFTNKVPSAHNMSRFVAKLAKHQGAILKMFVELSDQLYDLLPDFGVALAIDSKWVPSFAKRPSKRRHPDARSESEAQWGRKTYTGVHADGTPWSKTLSCFGFKVHLLVCTTYELPVAFLQTDASGSDIETGKTLLQGLQETRPHVLERCHYLMGDRGYDDTKLLLWLQEHEVKGIIDKRSMWREETEKELPGCVGSFYYNEQGQVFCYGAETGLRQEMKPAGYDKERDVLRKKCPVVLYGASCPEKDSCTYCKNLRIPRKIDPRIFTQVDRSSYKWAKLYRRRTAVERVNSRLDVSFGFEAHKLRGKKKVDIWMTLTLSVMNALAVGHIRENRPELMRSLVQTA